MAIKSPSLLWNIVQDLGKTDKEQARSNAGIDAIKGSLQDTKFLTHIEEDSSGNLEAKYAQAIPVYTETGTSLSGDYWDGLTDTKFRIIKSSPTPTSNNTSPEGGNMFALTGFYDRGNNNNYTVQLAMGDKLYYRHSENDGADWSDWVTVGREYSAGTDLKLTNGVFSVDTTSTMNDYCTCSFVLGQGNLIKDSDNCVLGGYSNDITGMNYSLVFGHNNTLGVTSSTVYENFGHGNILFGESNLVQRGDYNFVIGINNTISVPVIPSASADYPVRNIMIGEYNNIGKDASGVYGHDMILIGNGLSWSEPSCSPLLLGMYNSNDWRYKSDGYLPLRITGGGNSDSNRKNVEVVYTDGLIWSDSGFEVSDVYANGSSTYSTRIYKTFDTTTHDINGAGMWSRWTHRDRMSGNRVLDYTETANITNLTISLNSYKFDSDAVAFDNPNGLVNIDGVAQVLLKRTPPSPHDPSDKTYSPVLEFSSTIAGGNVGLTMGDSALPAWNVQEAASTSEIALTWLKVYANRNAAGDAGGDILPSDNSVPLGNLEVGKIAVRFYKESELTQANPLIPGQKVGDISFIVGDPSVSDHGFYIYDYYSPQLGVPATPQIHRETGYIHNGYQFCMLMTVEPSVFDGVTHMFVSPGSFCALYC